MTAHVPWVTPTLPWVSVAFHGPAFSTSERDYAALDLLLELQFGETSDLYQRLVEREQIVDQLGASNAAHADPSLASILARTKRIEDVEEVRDRILETIAACREQPIPAKRLEEMKSYARYGFARTLDNSESIAATLAQFVRFDRSYDTLNALFRRYAEVTPEDLQRVANTYLTHDRMVVTTLSHEDLPEALREPPARTVAAPAAAATSAVVRQAGPSQQLLLTFLFEAGSAHDPPGKEGLAALAAEMIAEAGSTELPIDEINRALLPIAGSFEAQVDREMTAFTGSVHRDNLERFAEVALPQLLSPGLREGDFERLKTRQLNALVQDLRANNEEELGKEALQVNLFAGTPYGHTTLGTVASVESLTLDDVRDFIAARYTQAGLTLGLSGDLPDDFVERLHRDLGALPAGSAPPVTQVLGRSPQGLEIEIVRKETRSTAISLGHPIAVTRAHPDFAALWLARAWLGEHRASHGRLFQRIREIRGLNYGDYAYIEAFPRGMYQFFPDPNLGRRAQLFEIWIRPVVPDHARFALKLAVYELRRLIDEGLSEDDFGAIREYLMKSVFIMTKTQHQQLGYALDSHWYGTGDFVETMRKQLSALTADDVNAAVRRHLSGTDLAAVIVTQDAEGLRDELLSGEPARIRYDAEKPAELLAEDESVGALDLGVRAEALRITPIEDVFAR